MIIQALEQIIKSGNQEFPIYIGFLKAEELLRVAEVPNFQINTANIDIATNVLTPPVKQWQRPLILENKQRITATFNGSGEFMPNPVLVAERCVGSPPDINIKIMNATGNIPTPIKEIIINESSITDEKPLWIIDGQHRITGLGDIKCKQRENPIPVVLLLNNGGNFYNGRNLAKIFAQVTTAATPLSTLHKEWLTFAFELDSYNNNPCSHRSMEAVAHLCKMPVNKITNKTNGFHDDIRFNDMLGSTPKYLGYQYDCKDFANIISTYYYSEQPETSHLSPIDLATQISMAFEVLKTKVKAPHSNSVFFGDSKHCHKIMCDAFLVGVFSYLNNVSNNPSENDWETLLTDLNFHVTDWNFNQHIVPNTRWVDKSKKLAIDVFRTIFKDNSLPTNVTDIWDYLSGDQLTIKMEFKRINNNDQPIKQDQYTVELSRGTKKTIQMDGRKYFKITNKSPNAKHIEIFDEKSSPSYPIKFKSNGEILIPPLVDPSNPSQNPLNITIKFTLYGGIEEKITVTLVDWSQL